MDVLRGGHAIAGLSVPVGFPLPPSHASRLSIATALSRRIAEPTRRAVFLFVQEHAAEDRYEPPPRVLCNMILAKKFWDHSPNSPLWVLDRYAARMERARASALRMLLTVQKRQPAAESEDDDAGFEEAGVPVVGMGASEAGEEIHNAPLRNEATARHTPADAQAVESTTDKTFEAAAAGDSATAREATAEAGVVEQCPTNDGSPPAHRHW